MAKFNQKVVNPKLDHPVTTTGETTTYEGGAAFTRDPFSELVLLAVVNMVGEETFYESGEDRDNRFVSLCRTAAVSDPANYLAFVRWLRSEANMRSAALVAAAEGVKARLDAGISEPFEVELLPQVDRIEKRLSGPRSFVNAALQRPDEPGEMVGYWQSHYGRNLPQPLKRGLADAAARLYTERSLLKYDTDSHAVRFGDVLDLVHPTPRAPWQGDLFTYALHRRPRRAGKHPEQVPDSLTVVLENRRLNGDTSAAAIATDWLDPEILRGAGMTWEDVLSALGSKVDKAKLWEAMIPNMGIMALLRNLRNFDEAGVSDKVAQLVTSRLQDPEQIAKSRQFPFRFLSAYRNAPSLRWSYPLERALDASLANVPEFTGRTAVFVDTSASMRGKVSGRSDITHVDVAALTGVTLAHRSKGAVDLIGFADGAFKYVIQDGGSVLKDVQGFNSHIGRVGHGTNTVAAVQSVYDRHDRVVIVHDGQYGNFAYAWPKLSTIVPAHVPLFSIDTSGYSKSAIDTSRPNRYEVGGFSDKLFTIMSLLDGGRSAKWPWVK